MSGSNLLYEAASVLKDHKRMYKRLSTQKDKLKKFSNWVLSAEGKKRSGHKYYDVWRPGSGHKEYLGNENNEQVLNVKRYRYADKAMEILGGNIELLEDLINNYVSPEYIEINSRLPVSYQTDIRSHVTASAGYVILPPEAIVWQQKLETEKAKYEPYKPEQLKHPTLKGIYVRSKSEAIIANMLFTAGIPFVYEAPIFINGEMVLPDFTILSLIDLKTVILIEHQGMVFDDDYAAKFIRSLKLYLQSDWIPNKDLFFTFDDARETLDIRQPLQILRKWVKPSIEIPDFEAYQTELVH